LWIFSRIVASGKTRSRIFLKKNIQLYIILFSLLLSSIAGTPPETAIAFEVESMHAKKGTE